MTGKGSQVKIVIKRYVEYSMEVNVSTRYFNLRMSRNTSSVGREKTGQMSMIGMFMVK